VRHVHVPITPVPNPTSDSFVASASENLAKVIGRALVFKSHNSDVRRMSSENDHIIGPLSVGDESYNSDGYV